MSGPYETDREVHNTPEVQAVYVGFDRDPGAGKMTPLNLRMLLDAVAAAGVRVGVFDVHILEWLAGWEPETCGVVAGLIGRASGGPASPEEAVKATVSRLAEPQADTLRQAFADAITLRRARFAERATCAECARYPADCADHQNDRDTALLYERLAANFGIDPNSDPWDGEDGAR